MSSITCPRCGAPVNVRQFFNAGYKPFCARCGWNVERAEAAVAGNKTALILIPLGVAAVGIFAAVGAARGMPAVVFALPVAFAAVMLLPVWRFFSTQRAIAAAKSSINPDLAQMQVPVDSELQQLQALPRPRRVQFRFGGNLAIGMVVFAAAVLMMGFAVFTLTAARGPRNVPQPASTLPIFLPVLFVALIAPLVILIPIFRDKRNRPLLRDGELALGRVTAQRIVPQGKSSYSRIDYEFKTSSGQAVQGWGRDLTGMVFEEMTIAVFYDAQNPSNNVTPCSTCLKLATNP